MGRIAVFLLLLLLVVPAVADDKKPAEQPPKPRTPEQGADAVLAAVKAKDEAALETLAEKDEPDPWLVAHELCYRGEHDAAEAFARAAPRKAVEALPAYVAARRGKGADEEARKAVVEINAALGKKDWTRALELAEAFGGGLETVAGIRARFARGLALDQLKRFEEAIRAFEEAGNAARSLGWLSRAAWAWWRIGIANDRARDRPAAQEALEEALRVYRALGDKKGTAFVLNSLGIVKMGIGKVEDALADFRESLDLKLELGDKRAAALTSRHLADAHWEAGDAPVALEHGKRAYELRRELGDERGTAMAALRLGMRLHELRRLAEAEAYLEASRTAAEKVDGGTWPDRAGVLWALARLQRDLGRPTAAEASLRRAREIHQQLSDAVRAARVLDSIAKVQTDRGAYAEALETMTRALEELKTNGDAEGEANALIGLGLIHHRMGDYPKALRAQARARRAAEALGKQKIRASALSNMGLTYIQIGDYARALSHLGRALDIDKKLGDPSATATTRTNIGLAYYRLGEYAKALSILEGTLADAERLKHRRLAAKILANLGNIHSSLGDHAKALATYRRGREALEAVEDRSHAATALDGIGRELIHLGRHDEGLACYRRAIAVHRSLGDGASVARVLHNIGLEHLWRGEDEEALRHLEDARAAAEAQGRRDLATNALTNIAKIHRRRGEFDLARETLELAARRAHQLRSAPLRVDALWLLALVHLDRAEPALALATAQQALDEVETMLGGLGEEEGALARQRHVGLFAIGAWAAALQENPAEVFRFLENGRAGALLDALGKREMLRWKAESLPPELREADREAAAAERVARRAYDAAVRGGKLPAIRAADEALDAATERVRAIAARIQRELKAQASLFYPRAELLGTVQAALAGDQALVIYGLCFEHAIALVLRRDAARIVRLGAVADLQGACEALDAGDHRVDSSTAVAALRRMLVHPLKLAEDVKQVLISPEGALCYMPFSLLFDRTAALTPSGSTHVLLRDELREAGRGVLALGDPDYGGVSEGARGIYYRGRRLTPLPATRAEVEAVGTRAVLGAQASVATLRATLPEQERWKAVHVAGHGLIDVERPMLSSLALSASDEDDGFLTALEVLRMEVPADLAVLSACETGTGRIVKGEGIVGLTRAFMFAGAPRVICSLWRVDDEATMALMVKFYELWNPKEGKGLGAAEALKQAQAYVRDFKDEGGKQKWKHPYYWAAWVLWGLPS